MTQIYNHHVQPTVSITQSCSHNGHRTCFCLAETQPGLCSAWADEEKSSSESNHGTSLKAGKLRSENRITYLATLTSQKNKENNFLANYNISFQFRRPH